MDYSLDRAIEKLREAKRVREKVCETLGTTPPEWADELSAYDAAIEALEKRIAQPVKRVRHDFYHEDNYCPSCGKRQPYTYRTRRSGCYCGTCGQHLTFPES